MTSLLVFRVKEMVTGFHQCLGPAAPPAVLLLLLILSYLKCDRPKRCK